MKNKVEDLRNHMFEALERLKDESMNDAKLKKEIERAKAVADVGRVIVESVKAELLYEKLKQKRTGIDGGKDARKFLQIDDKEEEE